jgi:hypothetical protein
VPGSDSRLSGSVFRNTGPSLFPYQSIDRSSLTETELDTDDSGLQHVRVHVWVQGLAYLEAQTGCGLLLALSVACNRKNNRYCLLSVCAERVMKHDAGSALLKLFL